MVKFMPDPLSRKEFQTLKQIGLLPVKMQATNQSEKRLVLLGFARKCSGVLH
jgi:hypothetical protein